MLREEVFGTADALAVTGDFNGDGVTDIGIFIDGQWFLDLNGNGQWDEGDLWAKLGSQDDLPVTGDWDGDGKTDIGIYGPAWPRDPWAIAHEPGLPDPDNFPTHAGRQDEEHAADRGRRHQRRPRAEAHRARQEPGRPDRPRLPLRRAGRRADHRRLERRRHPPDRRVPRRPVEPRHRRRRPLHRTATRVAAFGQAGDMPVVGDFNGDGIDEIGIFRDGKWIIDTNGNRELDAQDKVFELGGAGDQPVVGDWNDDGTDDPGVYQPGEPTDRVARRAG